MKSADLSMASQVKLLRLLQEGEYYPLGSDQPRISKARIIVATNHKLAAKEADGSFRRDLLYRLYSHRVQLPPLRDRKEDIQPLLDYFLDEAGNQSWQGDTKLSTRADHPVNHLPLPWKYP